VVTKDEIRRVIGYVRVSTDDQNDAGAGLAAQTKAIKAKAESKGWEVVRIAKDVASGKSMNGRHSLNAALADLKAHRADAILVAKLDRLSRSVPDFGSMLEKAHKQGWHVVMVDLELDTSTPGGELVAGVLMQVAQWERRMIGLRTKEALAVKRAQGVRLGRKRIISPATERRIRQLRERGLSYEAVAACLTTENIATPSGNLKPWSWQTVAQVVNRAPVKAGKVAS
jgi:DNA invertase Pin-like site-specific DNA recombinase